MYNKASSHEAFSKNNIRHTYTQKTHHLNLKAVVRAVGGAFTHCGVSEVRAVSGQKRVSVSSVDEEMQQKCFIKQILHKKDQKTAIATSV